VYPVHSSWDSEVMEALIDRVNMAFCLTIDLGVLRGRHLELNLKVLHELLSEVRGELTISVRENRAEVSIHSKYLVQKDLCSPFSINLFGNRE
jgi:hypothetical protein